MGEDDSIPETRRRSRRKDALTRIRPVAPHDADLFKAAKKCFDRETGKWPAPGSEDIELGVLMELEVGHGETEVYARVQT
jgi:hypothetical protein